MAAHSARQRSYTTVAHVAPRRSGVYPAPDPTGVCQCPPSHLANFCKPSGVELDFHTRFDRCEECGARPGTHMCCSTFKTFCAAHAKSHYQAHHDHHVMMNYEIWQYERCFWCFKCSGYCMNEAFDNVLEPMFSSKGSFCPKPVRAMHTESFLSEKFRASAATAQGWRSDNEDCHSVFLSLPGCEAAFFGVFDGHGGPLAARYVGQHLHKIFDTSMKALKGTPDAVEKALQRSFLAVDDALLNEYGEDCGTCGSTGCVVVVSEGHIMCGNAGDSRAVLCRSGRALPLSKDHRPTTESERKRIANAGSSVADERVDGMLAVSRAFGDFEFKQARNLPPQAQAVTCFPDVTVVSKTSEDAFVVVACDGIWDCMSSEKAVEFIQKELGSNSDPSAAAEALIRHCIADDIPDDGIGTDNMSVIIVRL